MSKLAGSFNKETDYETRFRCAGGQGYIRIETWVDRSGHIVFYNLAFIVPHLFADDNGRILGFDNAHGVHERHYLGQVEPVPYINFQTASERFYHEVRAWRKHYDNTGLR